MNITDSVLTSIKKLLGIAEEYEHFDADLIMHINSVFSILTQLGVGPSKGFMIEDKSATWKDFISDESKIHACQILYAFEGQTSFRSAA